MRNAAYEKNGYFVIKNLFGDEELKELRDALLNFHQLWIDDNLEFYNRRAVNSAYITGKKYLNDDKRRLLFKFIGNHKLIDVLKDVIPSDPAFMNTQLFFNPVNTKQNNYWHRDIQYTDKTIEEQKQAIIKTNVVHFRIPLARENGLELIPGTHRDWDNSEEFDVRTENNGRKCYEDLPRGKIVTLDVGDLLVFSASMIHRGIYGLDRLIFDILYCDSIPELLEYANIDCLPDDNDIKEIDNPEIFINTKNIKTNNNTLQRTANNALR